VVVQVELDLGAGGEGLAGDQVGGQAVERHGLAVGADDRVGGHAVARGRARGGRVADEGLGVRVVVVQEDVEGPVRVGLAGDDVDRVADEDGEATVLAHGVLGRHLAQAVGGLARRVGAVQGDGGVGAGGDVRGPARGRVGGVLDGEGEQVGAAVEVVLGGGDEVGGVAEVGDDVAVVAEDRGPGGGVAGGGGRAAVAAGQPSRPGGAVVHEGVQARGAVE